MKKVRNLIFGKKYCRLIIILIFVSMPGMGIAVVDPIFAGIHGERNYDNISHSYQKDCLQVVTPAAMGLSTNSLKRIDEIANYYVNKHAMPGCVVLAGRGNQIFFSKGYGNVDYTGNVNVDPVNTVYDLASITKVMATTLGAMKLYEEKKLDLNHSISYYLPEAKGNLGEIKVIQLLQHRSGLPAFVPFYKTTIIENKPDSNIYSVTKTKDFNILLRPHLYLHKDYPSVVWNEILNLKPEDQPKYIYSDINMVILGKIIERLTFKRLECFLDETYYKPMGLTHTFFRPFDAMKRAAKSVKSTIVITPTEIDQHFRMGKINGQVHDEIAAILGGVAGNAGLFSSASDLAKLSFMLKNGGFYAGHQYLKPETIEYFTQSSGLSSGHRLGWDAPNKKNNTYFALSSDKIFGHTGFTGTCVWIDPEKDLFFIFLSNRTFPDRNNQLLIQGKVREKIMEVFYRAIENHEFQTNPPITSR